MSEDLEQLKQRLPLLEYLQRTTGRIPCRRRRRVRGTLPVASGYAASFYINALKNLFYCHGCNCGGDLNPLR